MVVNAYTDEAISCGDFGDIFAFFASLSDGQTALHSPWNGCEGEAKVLK